MENKRPQTRKGARKPEKPDTEKHKTMPIAELQRENGFVRRKKKKQKRSFEKTALIPELSSEAIVGEEDNCKELGNTTALGSYAPPGNNLLKIWLKKWWMVVMSVLLVVILILWKSL